MPVELERARAALAADTVIPTVTGSGADRGVASPRAAARADTVIPTVTGSGADRGAVASPRLVAPPPGAGEGFDKQLVKRALFPRRAGPVRIGRFTVLGPIGRGGMGVVYACWDDELERKVAVKLLHADAARDPAIARARLLREAQAMARLSHANIVTVHEVGEAAGRVHVAMEFVRGQPLDAWVAATARPWQEVLAACLQAGRGLAAAHRAGLVHRDFKPQNVLVGDDGRVKVLDFGLARAADGAPALADGREDMSEESESALARPLTRTGQVMGTPLYMSPEQHRGERAGPASDQFSYCVSVYQCLYGRLPFAADSLGALIVELERGEVRPPPARTPVPARVFRALRRGLASDPRARFGAMEELLAALERDPAARVRRGAAGALLAGALGAASFAIGGPAAVERCPDARPALAGIWDEARRAEVAAAAPREVFAVVAPQLDRYAAAWTAMRGEACRAHAEARQSAQLFDLRTACLDQRRASLDALVAALATADAATGDGVIEAAAELPDLAGCADTEALTAAIAPPAEPGLRARVQAHREALARAQVREDAGQYQLGRGLVEAVLADPAAQAYRPLRAEALLRAGSLAMESGEHAAAEAALTAALWTAIGANHDAVAAQASAKRGYVTAILLNDGARAAVDVPLTTALNQRVREDIPVYAEFLTNVGAVAVAVGDLATGRRRWEEALALRERHGLVETPRGLDALANLGWLARAEGRYEDAAAYYERTAALSRRLLGEGHVTHLRQVWLYADALFRIGRPRTALARLREVERRFDRIENQYLRGMILHTLAVIERDIGEVAAARRHFEAAIAAVPEGSEIHEASLCVLVRVAAAEGGAAAEQAAAEQALARLPDPADVRDARVRCLLFERGRALEDLGLLRAAQASLTTLQAGLTGPQDGIERAEITIVLGRVLGALGELVAAAAELERALAALPPDSVVSADAMLELGEVALADGRFADAVAWSSQALAIYAPLVEPEHAPLARARFALARARTGEATRATPEARALAEQALAALRAGGRTSEAEAVAAWLAGRG